MVKQHKTPNSNEYINEHGEPKGRNDMSNITKRLAKKAQGELQARPARMQKLQELQKAQMLRGLQKPRLRALVAAVTAAVYGTGLVAPMVASAQQQPGGADVRQEGGIAGARFDSVVQNRSQSIGESANMLDAQQPTINPAGQLPLGVYSGASANGQVNYRANAAVGKIAVEIARDGMPADGHSATDVVVKVYDLKGQPVSGPVYITVEVNGGRLLLPTAKTDELGPEGLDLDKTTPGTQIKVSNGEARFKLLAPMQPQDVQMRVTAGKAFASGVISYLPELREMIAAGLVEGIISKSRMNASALSPTRAGDGFEQEINRWSRQFSNGKANYGVRTAFFIKGKISGDALLTASYDSDKDTRARLVRDIQPDKFYPVYGDSSIAGFDARSSDRLYVRVDKDKSYILYGDFATGSGFSQQIGGGAVASVQMRNLGQYNRTATGVRGHYEKDNVVVNAFATRDHLKQVIEEYAANGTSGPYAVRNNTALENSEKIEIVVRDKNQINVIKEVRQLARFVDYSFEPFSGRILLKAPVMALTPLGDAQSLRITYEVDQGGKDFWVGGVDGQVKVTKNVEIGGAIVEDKNPLAPYRIGSANVGVRLGENTIIVAEAAQSKSTQYQTGASIFATPTGQAGESKLDKSGRAFRVEVATGSKVDSGAKQDWNAKAWWAKSDVGFDNNATSYTQGKGEAGARVNVNLNETFSVKGEAIRSEDKLLQAKRSGEYLGLTAKATENLIFTGFARRIQENTTFPAQAFIGSNTAPLGTGAATGGFYGLGQSTGVLASTGVATAATAASQNLDGITVGLGVHYQATDALGLDAMVEGGKASQKRVVLGAQYQVAERTKLYAAAETQKGLASAYSLNGGDKSTSIRAGIDSSYMQGGSMFSEYRLRDAVSGQQADLTDMQLANGLRNTWNISEGVTANTGIEYLRMLKTNATANGRDALATSVGMDYTANPLWKLSGRVEYRRLFDDKVAAGDQRQDQWMSTLAAARKLDRDWTLLARNYLLYTKNRDDSAGLAKGNAMQDRFQLGTAWRPVDDNSVNALARYEYKMSRDLSQVGGENYRSHIVSAHMDYHPSRPWWLTGRVAGKLTTDYTLPADQRRYSAYLLSGRGVYDITEDWDIGALGGLMYSPQGKTKQYALGLETGYQLQSNLWASLGYNYKGFTDKDLTASDYTAKGVYMRLRFKFDESLFAGNDPEVNRALSREVK